MKRKVVLMLSVMWFLILAIVVGGVCYVIWNRHVPDIIPLERSLTHECRMKSSPDNTEGIGEHSPSGSSDCLLTIKGFHASGFLSSRQTGGHISTFSPIGSSNIHGLQTHGIESLIQAVLTTSKLEQVSRVSDLGSVDSLNMQQNTAQSESKRRCQICTRLREVLGVGGA